MPSTKTDQLIKDTFDQFFTNLPSMKIVLISTIPCRNPPCISEDVGINVHIEGFRQPLTGHYFVVSSDDIPIAFGTPWP